MNFFTVIDTGTLSLLPFSDSLVLLGALKTVTHLGDARVIGIIGLAMAVILWRRGRHPYWIGLAVAVCGATASSWLLKAYIARPRPLEPLIEATGYSLPSIHTAVAIALYGYLIFVTMRLMHPPHHRIPWAITLATTACLVAVSRIYLGAHHPTDVLAGIPLGALWVYAGYRAQQATTPRHGR